MGVPGPVSHLPPGVRVRPHAVSTDRPVHRDLHLHAARGRGQPAPMVLGTVDEVGGASATPGQNDGWYTGHNSDYIRVAHINSGWSL